MTVNDHWSVTVERLGDRVVTIESNCLSGRDLSVEDEEAIRTAAHHLLAFIGDPYPTYTEICRNEKCPRGGLEVEIIAPFSCRDNGD